MSIDLWRAVRAHGPGMGMLHNRHFRTGYMINDIGCVADLLRHRPGVDEFKMNATLAV